MIVQSITQQVYGGVWRELRRLVESTVPPDPRNEWLILYHREYAKYFIDTSAIAMYFINRWSSCRRGYQHYQ